VFDQVALAKKLGRSPAELARAIEALNRARASGDAEEVQRRFAELPAELRDSKPLRLAELMSGADLEPAAYSAIMERYRQDFPGDPSIDMVAVDYFFLKKDLPRTLEAIETVDRRVAGDPYLNVLRANAHPERRPGGREAIVVARAAVTAEPNLEPGWWALAMAQLRRGDHDAVAETVATLNLRFKAGIASWHVMEDEALWGAVFRLGGVLANGRHGPRRDGARRDRSSGRARPADVRHRAGDRRRRVEDLNARDHRSHLVRQEALAPRPGQAPLGRLGRAGRARVDRRRGRRRAVRGVERPRRRAESTATRSSARRSARSVRSGSCARCRRCRRRRRSTFRPRAWCERPLGAGRLRTDRRDHAVGRGLA
jgi:hypothetical protein